MSRRRRLFAAVVVVALAFGGAAYLGAGLLESPQASPTDADAPEEGTLIQPAENGTHLWPYTSTTPSVEGRTLAINVVIHGEPGAVRTALTDRTELEFEELPPEEEDAEGDAYLIEIEDGFEWDDAHGSTRFVYLGDDDGGEWVDESYQLHAGEYLGQRYHIRAYEDTAGDWTAVQVHREYFDFFRLRHTVTDIDDSAVRIEDEFIDEPFVEGVSREHYGLSGGWSDGWLSVIRLGSAPLLWALLVGSVVSASSQRAVRSLAGNTLTWTREHWRGFALVVSLVVLVTGVRSLGIALERFGPDVTPQLFAGGVYPLLVFGPPLLVWVFARRLDPLVAFSFAVVGLGAAFTLDTVWVGLGVIPVRLVLHRVGLMLALGVLALGVARRSRTDGAVDGERALFVAAGMLPWLLGLVMPLLDMV